MTVLEEDAEFLEHFGVKGMKWGVRKSRSSSAPSKLEIRDSDSAVTKNVKRDYNNMNNSDFRKKYAVGKGAYAKRVEKHGDPFKRRSETRIGKAELKRQAKYDAKAESGKTTSGKAKKAVAYTVGAYLLANLAVTTVAAGKVAAEMYVEQRGSLPISTLTNAQKSAAITSKIIERLP